MSIPSFTYNLDPHNQAHVDLVLSHFKDVRSYGKKFRPDPFEYYGSRNLHRAYFQSCKAYEKLEKIRDTISFDDVPPQVHYPDTYAKSFNDVLIIIAAHYPVHSNKSRPMQVNGDGDFIEPSLKAFADVWISILEKNGVHRTSARCMIYSSILVLNVFPISGNSSFAKSEIYSSVFEASREAVSEIMRHVVKAFLM